MGIIIKSEINNGKEYSVEKSDENAPCMCQGCSAEFDPELCKSLPNLCMSRKVIYKEAHETINS